MRTTPTTRTLALLASLAILRCGAQAGIGSDAGLDLRADLTVDGAQNRDGSTGADADAGAVRPFPLPVLRLDQRSIQGGWFMTQISGRLELPKSTPGFSSFSGVKLLGHGPTTQSSVKLGPTKLQGETYTATFTATLPTASSGKAQIYKSRELFAAQLPGTKIVLVGVLDQKLELALSVTSSALQALAVSRVPVDSGLPREVWWGAAPGDSATLDAAVPKVSAAIRALLAGGGGTGLGTSGRPLALGGKVFAAVDAGLADAKLSTPVVVGPVSNNRVVVIKNLRPGGRVALWEEGRGPCPTLTVPKGSTQLAFIFGIGVTPVGTPLVARQALSGTNAPQSAGSTARKRQAAPSGGPTAPKLSQKTTSSGTALVADGVSPGNWVLFSDVGYGFAAIWVPPKATRVVLPSAQIPSGGGIYRARQVTSLLVTSLESNAVIF
jgi:hypothetical protein